MHFLFVILGCKFLIVIKKLSKSERGLHPILRSSASQVEVNFARINPVDFECGYVANADFNAARNILAAGHTVLSVEGGYSKGCPKKQKASELPKEVTQ